MDRKIHKFKQSLVFIASVIKILPKQRVVINLDPIIT